MTTWPYVDCQGLAGAWTLGTIQTGGFDLVHRASLKGGFGDVAVESNRANLGTGDWEQDEGGSAAEWTPFEAAYVNGTPPCSGFSLLNVAAAAARKQGKDTPITKRGVDSAINECMRELVRYAAKCTGTDGRRGPEVVSFESVQGAGKEGRPLMQALRDVLEGATGNTYGLSHVFMSGASVGAAQMRHRYFVVFHRIPFGIDPTEPRRVATYRDAISDLRELKLQWEPQVVAYGPHIDDDWWLCEQEIRQPHDVVKATYLVDAHATYGGENDGSRARRIYLDEFLPLWSEGMSREDVMREYLRRNGRMPEGAERWWVTEEDQPRGFSGPRRIDPDRPGYVMTGGAVSEFFHWAEDRYLTVRECARLMGYPDSWSFSAASGINQASNWIGKCCPCQSGRWISEWVLRALNGEPGAALEKIGECEYRYNNTLDYKRWPREVSKLSTSVK